MMKGFKMKEKSTIQDTNTTLSKKPLDRNYTGFQKIALDNGDIKYFANSDEGYFTDKGKRVEVGETQDESVLRTALEHASLKFVKFQLKGTDAEIKALATQAIKMQLEFKIQADDTLKAYIESEKKRLQEVERAHAEKVKQEAELKAKLEKERVEKDRAAKAKQEADAKAKIDQERENKLRDASKNLSVEPAQLPAAKMQVEARKLETKSDRWIDQAKNPPALKIDGVQVYSNDIEHKLPASELNAIATEEKKENVTEQVTPEKRDDKSFTREATGEIRANFEKMYYDSGKYTADGQTEVAARERARETHIQKLKQQAANLLAAGDIGGAVRTQLQSEIEKLAGLEGKNTFNRDMYGIETAKIQQRVAENDLKYPNANFDTAQSRLAKHAEQVDLITKDAQARVADLEKEAAAIREQNRPKDLRSNLSADMQVIYDEILIEFKQAMKADRNYKHDFILNEKEQVRFDTEYAPKKIEAIFLERKARVAALAPKAQEETQVAQPVVELKEALQASTEIEASAEAQKPEVQDLSISKNNVSRKVAVQTPNEIEASNLEPQKLEVAVNANDQSQEQVKLSGARIFAFEKGSTIIDMSQIVKEALKNVDQDLCQSL